MTESHSDTIGKLYRAIEAAPRGTQSATDLAFAHDAYVKLLGEYTQMETRLAERNMEVLEANGRTKRANETVNKLRADALEAGGAAVVEQRRLNAEIQRVNDAYTNMSTQHGDKVREVMDLREQFRLVNEDLRCSRKQVMQLISYLGRDDVKLKEHMSDPFHCSKEEVMLIQGRYDRLLKLARVAGNEVTETADGSLFVTNTAASASLWKAKFDQLVDATCKAGNRVRLGLTDKMEISVENCVNDSQVIGDLVKVRDALRVSNEDLTKFNKELAEERETLRFERRQAQEENRELRISRETIAKALAAKEEVLAQEKALRKRHARSREALRDAVAEAMKKGQYVMDDTSDSANNVAMSDNRDELCQACRVRPCSCTVKP